MLEKKLNSKTNTTKIKLNNTITSGKIILRKKSIDNGDLSKYILNDLKNKTSKPKIIVKPLSLTQKKVKDEIDFVTSIKSIKNDQESLNQQLKKVPFCTNNKNIQINSKRKLPKTLEEIDENEDLARMLLKNPNDMTAEEKIYISSLNNEEFKIFVGFLKRKNKELSWRGNDLGSGHYINNYINIYRHTGHSENENYLSLQKFLKLNYQNQNAENSKKGLSYLQPSDRDETHKLNINSNMDSNTTSHVKNNSSFFINKEKDEMRNKGFETTSQIIFKELENFKNILLDHKNEVNLKKIEAQNNIIYGDLERKSKLMRDDVTKMKNIKKDSTKSSNTNDVDKLYENFKQNSKNISNDWTNHTQESSVIKKIQLYLERMSISASDLVNKLDHDSIVTSLVSLSKAKEVLIKLDILDEPEAENLCVTLKLYHGNKVKVYYLICILEAFVYDDIKDILKENYDEEENLNENDDYNNNSDEEYDYFSIDVDNKGSNTDEKRRKLLSVRALQDYDFLIKKKAVLHIQRVFRGCQARKQHKVYFIYLCMMAKRITYRMRRFNDKMKKIKNDSAHKITYLMRKHYINKNLNHKLSNATHKWLMEGKNLNNFEFSYKNKIRCAINIQKAWRNYKSNVMKKFFDKNSTTMDINMLKTKTCFICMANRVSHLCRDCENNHYCESCFLKFHTRGAKRNHSYLKIKSIMEEFKKKKEKLSIVAGAYNDISIVKNYLEENQFNLYEIFQIWDFKKNNTILYKHLKDALNVRGFKFAHNIRDIILNLALKFIVDENQKMSNIDNVAINYEAFWLELV